MSHALTKLVLETTMGTEAEDETIDKVEVKNMYASGTWNISGNAWTGLGEANATLEMTDNELLVIPMASCTSFPIIITTSTDRVFKADISLEEVENKLVANTAYTIKLQVGQSKATTAIDNEAPGWNNDSEGT